MALRTPYRTITRSLGRAARAARSGPTGSATRGASRSISETGDLWTGDVGQNALEEVDVVRRGGNYGWNVMEGSRCFRSSSCNVDDFEPPVAEYGRDLGCSITGGYVYRGQRLPELRGVYLYADYCSGRIWGLRYDGERVTEQAQLARASFQVPSFGEDEAGEVYVLGFDGGIYALAAPPGQTGQAEYPHRHSRQQHRKRSPRPAPAPAATGTPLPATASTPAANPTPTPTETHLPTMSSGGVAWAVVVVVVVAGFAAGFFYARRRSRKARRR